MTVGEWMGGESDSGGNGWEVRVTVGEWMGGESDGGGMDGR